MALQFRTATREDLPDLMRLYRQLGHPSASPSAEALEAAYARTAAQPGCAIWLAEDSGETLGTFLLAVFEALGARCRPVGVVEDVVVDEAARGRGIGRAMMEHAMRLCRERGCYKMQLTSNLRREDAHRFYDGLGFTRHGVSFVVEL